MGANVPGKPRVLLAYVGGLTNYRLQCEMGEANHYANFEVKR
jgi:cyclohexanone monooxygenase